ncbi:MAG: DNA translocase FtsK 4TM domain-containing protein [Rickettsiales bacterium]
MGSRVNYQEYYEEEAVHPLGILSGCLLCIASLFVMMCLISYNQLDPSLNKSTSDPVLNWGGYSGALISDLCLQLLGLASAFVVLVPLVWGVKIIKGYSISFLWMRISLLLVTLVLSATVLSKIEPPLSWPISSGFGGSIGSLIYERILFQPFKNILFTTTVASITIVTASLSFGMSWTEWKGLAHLTKNIFTTIYDKLSYTVSIVLSFIYNKIQRRGETEEYEYEEEIEYEEEEGSGYLPTFRERIASWFDRFRRDDEEYEDDEDYEEEYEEPVKSKPRVTQKNKTQPPKKSPPKKDDSNFSLDFGDYELPSVKLLKLPPRSKKNNLSESALTQNAKLLESVLQDFGVNGSIIEIRPGPVVTLYELEPAAGTKSSRVIGLADDIARSMSAISTRIAVIPGRNAIGIEMPNNIRETVYFREILESDEFDSSQAKLPMALGKNIGGEPIIVDLARMPHLLVAGTTGSGKSVAVNTMIMSLLYSLTPEECKFIMIDPKMLELSVYDGIPHLLSPVVTEPGKAVVALKWTVKEMENRYRLMNNHAVRNIEGYNKKIREARAKGDQLTRKVQTGFDPDSGEPIIEEMPLEMEELPFIVVVVDEMADLMVVAGKEIEGSIQRLAQMARAAGIHIIMATQRPSVDVITGVIKANFPTRISFQVTSRIDSRTILGEQGAEQLLGQGDMLYMAGGGRITRVHGPFVSDREVEEVVSYLKSQGEPSYIEDVTKEEESEGMLDGGGEVDPMYDQAVAIVARDRKASTSYIQRCLKIGYNRAATIIEQMERDGVIGPANHVGKREILVREED